MPVYIQQYRLWNGLPRPQWLRWSVILRYHLRLLFTQKGRTGIIVLLVISGITHFVFLGIIYLLSNVEFLTAFRIPQENLPEIKPGFFLAAFVPQSILVGILALIVGAGLIADDRRDNAIPLYLSKPLTPTEYLLGKFSVMAVFFLGITALPINLLFVFEVLMHGGWAFFKEYWWLPISITTFSLLITGLTGTIMLMASSLVKKGSQAGVIVIGLFIGNHIVAGIFRDVFDSWKLLILSLQFDVSRVGLWLFTIEITDAGPLSISGPSAALMILAVTAVCWAVVWWRIRPVEVVK